MPHLPDDQLSKASLKATADTLAHLETQHAKIGSTIDVLRGLLRAAGYAQNGNQNGASPERTERSGADAARIVDKARAKFATRVQALQRRRTQAEWQADILAALRGGPLSFPALMTALRASPGSKTSVYKALGTALKARHVWGNTAASEVASNGHSLTVYTLTAMTGKKTPTKKRRHTRGHGFAKRILAQRQRTADALARFDAETPRPGAAVGHGLGSYVARGYLRKTKDGYLRTSKEFQVQP